MLYSLSLYPTHTHTLNPKTKTLSPAPFRVRRPCIRYASPKNRNDDNDSACERRFSWRMRWRLRVPPEWERESETGKNITTHWKHWDLCIISVIIAAGRFKCIKRYRTMCSRRIEANACWPQSWGNRTARCHNTIPKPPDAIPYHTSMHTFYARFSPKIPNELCSVRSWRHRIYANDCATALRWICAK